MKITRSNYEIFFLDYHDGSLDETARAELFSFLEANPDLKEEFENFSNIPLEIPEVTFAGKESLKKETITILNYKTWMIASMEGDLDREKESLLEAFLLMHPELKRDRELFTRTKSVADERIIFEDKSLLRKGGRVIAFNRVTVRAVSIAASIAILLVSYFLFIDRKPQRQEVVEVKEQTTVPSLKEDGRNDSSDQKPENIEVKESATHFPEKHLAEKPVKQSMKSHTPRKRNETVPVIKESTREEPVIQEQMNPVEETIRPEPSLAENKSEIPQENHSIPVENHTSANDNPLAIFTEAELAEMGIAAGTNNASIVDLAAKGIQKITRATGADLEVRNDPMNERVTYAFEAGRFGFSHSSRK